MNPSPTESAAAAGALERFLGDPREASSKLSFREALALDEAEEFPERPLAALEAWGLSRFYVPEALGGALRAFEVTAALVRVVARRDLTTAIAHAKTFLGAVPVWLGGSETQRARLGAEVLAGARVALGLTEEAHGGDLFATETTATQVDSGYELSGEKWLINNATRGDAITVLARTDPRGGPRGFSLFLVEKRGSQGVTHLQKLRTHGIRGADISGVRFERTRLPPNALVGGEGRGLELTMTSLQVTRTLVPALSLGALDTALRQVLDFARARRLGQGTVLELPHARGVLTDAFVTLLVSEALVRVGARSLHAAPERMALWSAVVKSWVPARVDAALRRLAAILGARHYLRASPFEKLLRDHALVGLFDGSTVVNLSTLALELPRLALQRSRPRAEASQLRQRIHGLYALRSAPLPFAPGGLEVLSRGLDEGPLTLAMAREQLASLRGSDLDPEVLSWLERTTDRLDEAIGECVAGAPAGERSLRQSPEAFESAERYARLHAATVCLALWTHSREDLDGFFARGDWLVLALGGLVPGASALPSGCSERVLQRLLALAETDHTFALEPVLCGVSSGELP